MTQEEKQLLLRDLCARLPYGVKYCRDSWNYEWDQEMSVVEVLEDIDKDGYINYHKVYKVWDIKPYLRPMSSMTEEEREDAREKFFDGSDHYDIDDIGEIYADTYQPYTTVYTLSFARLSGYIDWLNAHHFDYRIDPSTGKTLIESNLAIVAPEEMYGNV